MNFNFCPNCGREGSVEQQNPTDYACANCGWRYWNNARACVAIVFIKGDKFLAAKRGLEPKKGKYDFPGGFSEYNENPEACVRREIAEETGLTVKKLRLLTVFANEYIPGISCWDVCYLAEEWEGEFEAKDDVAQLEWRPFSFIDSRQFSVPYPGLAAILTKYATIK